MEEKFFEVVRWLAFVGIFCFGLGMIAILIVGLGAPEAVADALLPAAAWTAGIGLVAIVVAGMLKCAYALSELFNDGL